MFGEWNSVRVPLLQEGEETAAEERAMEARSMPIWLEVNHGTLMTHDQL